MLFLKKLRLNGFKSFGEKTELVFKPGIAGIVGPNGCGKSNIVDALKWVFGEKRVSAIRGETAADIIFVGNEEIKPLGMAEVEVILNNSESLLPLEYSEISVTRRVFRSGENEYAINKTKCRLKDIHSLFANTGVGKGSYSFMEQGKMAQIMDSKPEDRRIIFEEAAGIAGYKAKLKETIQTLNTTEKNLAQVNLLIQEISKEREKYKKQAEVAKIYNEKNKKLKELEILIYTHRYMKIKKRLDKVLDKIKIINSKIESSKKEYDAVNLKLEDINKELLKHNTDKAKFEREKLSLEHIINNNNEKIEIYKQQLINFDSDLERYEKKKSFLKEELNKINKELNDIKLLFEKNKSELNNISEKIRLITKLIEEKNMKMNLNYETINKNRLTIKNNQEELIKLKEELRKYTDEFINEIDKKKQEVESRDDFQQNFKNKVVDLINKVETNIKELEEASVQKNDAKVGELISEVNKTLENLKNIIQDIVIHQDEFKNLIFDKEGPYAKKEKTDKEINRISDEIFKLQNQIAELDTENQALRKEEKDLERKREELYNDKNKLKQSIAVYEHNINNLIEHKKRNEEELITLESDIKNIKEKKNKIKADIKTLEDINKKHIKELKSIESSINKFLNELKKNSKNIADTKSKIENLTARIEKLRDESSQINEERIKLETNLEDIKSVIYEEHNTKIEDALKSYKEDLDIKKINSELDKVKKEIKDLGHPNLLAEELYEDISKRFKLYTENRDDLLKSKEDLLKIIDEVNKESEKLFIETFNKIKENYNNIFRKLFGGGKATVELLDKENILESGIEINVQPPGKKPGSITWLSGGEKALSAVALMFAIFMVKPSPFCVLDEIDAPLDDNNIGKFLALMKEFSRKTQFLIVSHNKITISACDYLYGITMEGNKGISNVISLDLKKSNIDDYISNE